MGYKENVILICSFFPKCFYKDNCHQVATIFSSSNFTVLIYNLHEPHNIDLELLYNFGAFSLPRGRPIFMAKFLRLYTMATM